MTELMSGMPLNTFDDCSKINDTVILHNLYLRKRVTGAGKGYDINMSLTTIIVNPTIFWLVVFVACIVIEIISMGLTTIWFAGGALVSAVAAALSAPVWLQIVLFFGVSLILIYFTRPIAVKYFNKDRVKTNAESLVGQQAIVISEINNLQGIGRVLVNGQEWSARNVDDSAQLAVGSVVIVRAISGVKLMVEEKVIS